MTKKLKKMLIRIIVTAVLLVALHFVPVSGIARFLLYLIPCGIICWLQDLYVKCTSGI